jgi:hypothetical protein
MDMSMQHGHGHGAWTLAEELAEVSKNSQKYLQKLAKVLAKDRGI